MCYFTLTDERGSILLGGLMLVLIVTLVGVAIFGLSASESRLLVNAQSKGQAAFAAEAGLNIAWNQMAAGTPTFATVWTNAVGSNIVPASGTAWLAAASGSSQADYQVQKCDALYPAACDAGTLPATNFAVRSTGRVLRGGVLAGQAVAEIVFDRTILSSPFQGALGTQTSATLSGGGGSIDAWDCSTTYGPTPTHPLGCSTAPCPYDPDVATSGGDIWSNGTLTFPSNDPGDVLHGNVTAVGNITLGTSHVYGDLQTGGTVTSSKKNAISSVIDGNAIATGNITGPTSAPFGIIGGNATAGGTITGETVGGTTQAGVSPPPAPPAPKVWPPVPDCNTTGSGPGQYLPGDPTRAASGYSMATDVASKVSGPYTYDETSGVFKVSSSTVTLLSGTNVGTATFCFNTITFSGGSTINMSGSITAAQPINFYMTNISGKSDMSGGTFVNPSHDASRLGFYSSSTDPNKGIVLSGGGDAYLTLYAPGTNVTLSGGSAVYGAVISNTFSGTGGSDVHYDACLGTAPSPFGGSAPAYKIVTNSWRMTVQQ